LDKRAYGAEVGEIEALPQESKPKTGETSSFSKRSATLAAAAAMVVQVDEILNNLGSDPQLPRDAGNIFSEVDQVHDLVAVARVRMLARFVIHPLRA
jgi:hypothetical protein